MVSSQINFDLSTYTVTLNIRSSLKALNTDKPKEPAFGLKCDHITSKTLPEITMQSKRLNEAWKYTFGPKAHIRKNISKMNRPRNTYSVQSVKEKLKSLYYFVLGYFLTC